MDELVATPNELLIIALADEGIPLRAISRALAVSSTEVYDLVQEAIEAGKLVERPKDDWPPHTRLQRTPQFIRSLDDDTKLFSCMNLFKISRTQAVVLLALMARPYAPRPYLHLALQQFRHDTAHETEIKMVDVVVCHLRKRLKAFDITIETVWGAGYHLTEESRDTIQNALEQHVREITVPREDKVAA